MVKAAHAGAVCHVVHRKGVVRGELPLRDRIAAGRVLAAALSSWRQQPDVIVLALPRGGVPVGEEIARALEVRLDLMLVRKLGVPGNKELAMGAIASGGVQVLNEHVLRYLDLSPEDIATAARHETAELQRRDQLYRGSRPLPLLRGQHVILVDDGLATGATMRAAIQAVHQQVPAEIIVAIPVGAPDSVAQIRGLVDQVICPFTPEPFAAIGQWYMDFDQVSDQEVQELLQQAWAREAAGRRHHAP